MFLACLEISHLGLLAEWEDTERRKEKQGRTKYKGSMFRGDGGGCKPRSC